MLKFLICFYSCICVINSVTTVHSSPGMRYDSIDPTPAHKLLAEDKNYWYKIGEETLKRNLKFDREKRISVAKNVVLFVGDGMGISTITSTRIYKGQRKGKSGEDHVLAYENFPNVALVKTYNVNMQVPDSAGTGTALFTGVKTNYEAVGVDAKSNRTILDKDVYEESKVDSIMIWAQQANKSTGIITTTRITDATPAATYSHVNHREWECDSKIPDEHKKKIKDIARQLIEDEPGRNFQVVLGGGSQQLGHEVEAGSSECLRTDGLNLTKIWLEDHKSAKSAFVTNNEELGNISDDTEFLMGLFHPSHLPYELLRDKGPKGTPSLLEMTKRSLEVLRKNKNGFVLMVEGGRIDHGHHENLARIALEEAAQFEEAIAAVLEEIDKETLIIVTADHSHGFTLNGYAQRGNDILGYGISDALKKPGLTLTYANGPGFDYHYTPNEPSILGPWRDVTSDPNRLNDPQYRHMATYHTDIESHAGEDVALFAKGPGSHLVRGVVEQNYVAHLISYAACIGPRTPLNDHCFKQGNSSGVSRIETYGGALMLVMVAKYLFKLFV